MPASVRWCRCVEEPQAWVDAVGACEVSLRKTSGTLAKEDLGAGMHGRRERQDITAASAAYLNHPVELTFGFKLKPNLFLAILPDRRKTQ
jgi:hypothetical protein